MAVLAFSVNMRSAGDRGRLARARPASASVPERCRPPSATPTGTAVSVPVVVAAAWQAAGIGIRAAGIGRRGPGGGGRGISRRAPHGVRPGRPTAPWAWRSFDSLRALKGAPLAQDDGRREARPSHRAGSVVAHRCVGVGRRAREPGSGFGGGARESERPRGVSRRRGSRRPPASSTGTARPPRPPSPAPRLPPPVSRLPLPAPWPPAPCLSPPIPIPIPMAMLAFCGDGGDRGSVRRIAAPTRVVDRGRTAAAPPAPRLPLPAPCLPPPASRLRSRSRSRWRRRGSATGTATGTASAAAAGAGSASAAGSATGSATASAADGSGGDGRGDGGRHGADPTWVRSGRLAAVGASL